MAPPIELTPAVLVNVSGAEAAALTVAVQRVSVLPVSQLLPTVGEVTTLVNTLPVLRMLFSTTE